MASRQILVDVYSTRTWCVWRDTHLYKNQTKNIIWNEVFCLAKLLSELIPNREDQNTFRLFLWFIIIRDFQDPLLSKVKQDATNLSYWLDAQWKIVFLKIYFSTAPLPHTQTPVTTYTEWGQPRDVTFVHRNNWLMIAALPLVGTILTSVLLTSCSCVSREWRRREFLSQCWETVPCSKTYPNLKWHSASLISGASNNYSNYILFYMMSKINTGDTQTLGL